jgi:ActR/RegA family two-component response regulator
MGRLNIAVLLDHLNFFGQVVEEIQSMFPGQKAIIVSGHASNQRADNAISRGVPWLAKPYDVSTLANAVADILRDDARSHY